MNEEYEELVKRVEKVKTQLAALSYMALNLSHLPLEGLPSGSSVPVMWGPEHVYERYAYHANRCLYHALRFIDELANPPFPFPFKDNPKEGGYATGPVLNPELFYEFDAFIATAGTHFESPFKKDFQQAFSKSRRKRLDKVFPTKQSEDSLFWRLQLIRNRVVHPDEPTYAHNGGRYLEFSSSGARYIHKDGVLKIEANLIDIADSEKLRTFLREFVIEPTKKIKKQRTGGAPPQLPNFHELLFAHGKREGKTSPVVRSRGCDLIRSFAGILDEMLKYFCQINLLFRDEMVKRLSWGDRDEVYFLPGIPGTVQGHSESPPAHDERDVIAMSELFV